MSVRGDQRPPAGPPSVHGHAEASGCEEGFQIDGNGSVLEFNKVSNILDNCFDVQSSNNTLTSNKASGCNDGFEVTGTGNVFTTNSSKAADDDLRDFNDEGANTYTGNKFAKKVFGPPVP